LGGTAFRIRLIENVSSNDVPFLTAILTTCFLLLIEVDHEVMSQIKMISQVRGNS